MTKREKLILTILSVVTALGVLITLILDGARDALRGL